MAAPAIDSAAAAATHGGGGAARPPGLTETARAAAFPALPPDLAPVPHPDPNPILQARFRVPRYAVPGAIGDMEITPELRAMYRGHEALLKRRAEHPPGCRGVYDAVAMCVAMRWDDATCARVDAVYRPCAAEMASRARAVAGPAGGGAAGDDERRRRLTAASRALERRRADAAAAAVGGGDAAALAAAGLPPLAVAGEAPPR